MNIIPMNYTLLWIVFFSHLTVSGCANVKHDFRSKLRGTTQHIVTDYDNFYSMENMGLLAAGLGITGILANTKADQEVRDWYQEAVKSETTDDVAKIVKPLGNGRYTVPIFLGMSFIGEISQESRTGSIAGKWAKQSLRIMLVGVPHLLFLQNALGASRPEEKNSHWHSFEDGQGVSGHSFMGAVPFLSAALTTDNFYLKALFMMSSTLCSLSRINDDKHYFSQTAMGWYLAYLSAKSVRNTNKQNQKVSFSPIIFADGTGIVVKLQF